MPSKKDTRVIYHSFVVLVVHSMSYHIVIYYECVYSSFITFFPYGIIYDIMMFLSLFGVAVDSTDSYIPGRIHTRKYTVYHVS